MSVRGGVKRKERIRKSVEAEHKSIWIHKLCLFVLNDKCQEVKCFPWLFVCCMHLYIHMYHDKRTVG